MKRIMRSVFRVMYANRIRRFRVLTSRARAGQGLRADGSDWFEVGI